MELKAPRLKGTLLINGYFLQAFMCAVSAWFLWPSSLEWWGFGLLSIILGMVALRKSAEAFGTMAKLYSREKELSRFAATSRAPEPSDLADQNALKDAGMIDD